VSTQTRLVSLIETCINTGLGFCVAFMIWPPVAMLYGFDYSVSTNLGITSIFTVSSIARGYMVRRLFANRIHEAAIRMARRFVGAEQ
jgi:hypothetical protein